MDYKFAPVVRKISIDRIQIPFFYNDPGFKILDFVKVLYKYRSVLERIRENYEDGPSITLKRPNVKFKTNSSPKKNRNF